jgi:hypothetical protein
MSCFKYNKYNNMHGAKVKILHTIKRNKANWIGYMLCRNFLLELVVEEKIEETER